MGFNNLDDSREGIDKYLKRNPSTCFVAVEGDSVFGVILSGHDGRRGFIHHLAVSEDGTETLLAGGEGEEEAASVIVAAIISMRTTPAWKAILAGLSCLHKYFLRTVFGKVIIKGVRFELLLR